jgi:hypothetical protein
MGGTLLIGLPPSSSGAFHCRIPLAAGLSPYLKTLETQPHFLISSFQIWTHTWEEFTNRQRLNWQRIHKDTPRVPGMLDMDANLGREREDEWLWERRWKISNKQEHKGTWNMSERCFDSCWWCCGVCSKRARCYALPYSTLLQWNRQQ